MSTSPTRDFRRTLGTWEVAVTGIALVVAANTLASDFTGYFTLGASFATAMVIGFGINLLLGISVADLSVAHPRCGAIYDYAREIFEGRRGEFLGVFLGLSCYAMFAMTVSGKTSAGAHGLQALLGTHWPLEVYIVTLSLLAILPNLFGIRTTAWVSAGLLLLMLGIRWFFGLAGFFGLGATGPWSAANLESEIGVFELFGDHGILAAGLALAFWSFAGIEFACSLAGEVKRPAKAMPRGIIIGLLVVLSTSLVMGLGVTGTAPLATWRTATAGALSRAGDAPHLAVGQVMFGSTGFALMALASVAATLGTLTIAYAALSRLVYSIARRGRFFGPLSRPIAQLSPRFGTPRAAVMLTFVVFLAPALLGTSVVDWLDSAAYVWILLYVAFHVLALCSRSYRPRARRAFQGQWFTASACSGIVMTGIALYCAFAGQHAEHGRRALLILGACLATTALCFLLPSNVPFEPEEQHGPLPSHPPMSGTMGARSAVWTVHEDRLNT